MSFVTFEPQFIATKYPGYFFNTNDNKLYSLKIDGVLKPLKFHSPNRWNHYGSFPITLLNGTKVYSKGGYQVSVKGRHRFYAIETLKEIKEHNSIIPVNEKVYG